MLNLQHHSDVEGHWRFKEQVVEHLIFLLTYRTSMQHYKRLSQFTALDLMQLYDIQIHVLPCSQG